MVGSRVEQGKSLGNDAASAGLTGALEDAFPLEWSG